LPDPEIDDIRRAYSSSTRSAQSASVQRSRHSSAAAQDRPDQSTAQQLAVARADKCDEIAKAFLGRARALNRIG
jgi:hypothetical protein